MTPNSGANPYITPQQFLAWKDIRSIYQACTDSDQDPLLVNSPVSSNAAMAAVLVNPATTQGANLLEILAGASGMLESACLRSERYSVADLLALQGNSAAYMRRTIASIAFWDCLGRRPGPAPSETAKADYDEAMAALKDLSEGVAIFAFVEAAAAGLPATRVEGIWDAIANDQITARWPAMWGERALNRRFGGSGRWW